MAKQYRTARGKGIDLSQILNDNEFTRAVGNMNVNARGDVLDSQNKTIQPRNDRVKNQYRKQHKTVVADDIVPTSKKHAAKLAAQRKAEMSAHDIAAQYTERLEEKMQQQEEMVIVTPPPVVNPEPVAEEPTAVPAPVTEQSTTPKGGLAAAIAKARESKQELMKTPRQQARETTGVKKI